MSSGPMSIYEHLGELRGRLKKVFIAFGIVLIILVFLPSNPADQVQHLDQYTTLQFLAHTVIAAFLHRVQADVLPAGWTLIAAKGIGEGMEVYFVAALLLAVMICMPVIAYETYRFVDPALKPEERGLIYPFVISTSLLFIVGIIFGYFVLARFLVLALSPFFTATGTSLAMDSAAFYYVIFLIIGSTGAAFTVPVFIYALIMLRVIQADLFSRNRVTVWFVVWIVTGLFLTPDGGPLLDLVLFLPIITLVEGAVYLGRRSVNRSKKGQAEKQATPEKPVPVCKYCGAKLSPGMPFCPKCGRAV